MTEKIKIKCNECKKEFYPGNRPDGLPNGVGFETKDGSIINVCSDCIIKLGTNLRKDKN